MLKFLKTLFNGSLLPKAGYFIKYGMTVGEAGVIQLIPLLLILAGIIAGVYLVQKSGYQIFKPKATAETIDILPGDCIKEKDGKKVLVCDRFQFKVTSPLETGQSSDAGPNMSVVPNLVKTAYAATFPNGYCKDDKSKIYYRIGSEEREARFCRSNEECKEVEGGADCVATGVVGGGGWVCKDETTLNKGGIKIPFTNIWLPFIGTDQKCPDNTQCKQEGNSASCVEKEQPVVRGPSSQVGPSICYSQQKANVNGDKNKDCFICQGNTVMGVRPDGSEYVQSECPSGETCQPIDPGNLISDVGCIAKPVITPKAESSAPPPRAVIPTEVPAPTSLLAKCGDNPSTLKPGERPQGYSWIAICSKTCTKNEECLVPSDGYTDPKTNGWCYQFQEGLRCMTLKYTATAAPPAEKVSPSPSPSPSPQATRFTTKFRLASNPKDLEKAPWYDYTSGGVTVSAPSPYYSIGSPKLNETYSIFVQFMDNQNQIIKFPAGQTYDVKSIQFVDIATIREAASPSPAGDQSVSRPQISCNGVSVGGANQPGQQAVAQITYNGSPASIQVWMASNSEVGKIASQVTSWTSVKSKAAPANSVSFTIPSDMVSGSHAVLVSLHDADGSMLDGNVSGTVNLKCASFINIQSGATTIQPTPIEPAGPTYTAQCNSVSVVGASSVGSIGTVNLSYSGNPSYLQVWVASNEAVGKSVDQVGNNWTLVRDYGTASNGLVLFNIPSDMTPGTHAVLVALFDPKLNMLDGNPAGIVNPKCATSMTIR